MNIVFIQLIKIFIKKYSNSQYVDNIRRSDKMCDRIIYFNRTFRVMFNDALDVEIPNEVWAVES